MRGICDRLIGLSCPYYCFGSPACLLYTRFAFCPGGKGPIRAAQTFYTETDLASAADYTRQSDAPPAFDHGNYIFELKMDGFWALAYVGQHETRLVSHRGNVYKRFTELTAALHVELDCQAVLDGEIVCLDEKGRPQSYDLLRRRGEPVFYAFDLLWLDGVDLRLRPLIERKRLLRSIVAEQPSVMLYAEHIERCGVEFFQLTLY